MYILMIIGMILIVVGLVGLIIGLTGVVYWGLGAFICWAFKIPFEFGFAQGLALAFIIEIIKCFVNSIFPKKGKEDKEIKIAEQIINLIDKKSK